MDAAVGDQLDAAPCAPPRGAPGRSPRGRPPPGVSSMIRSTPVACSKARMLRPSRPMMRPFISSLGSADDGDGRLAGVVGGDPLHDGGQDASRALVPLLERVSLDLAHAMLRLGLGSSTIWRISPSRASAADSPRRARARQAVAAGARASRAASASSSLLPRGAAPLRGPRGGHLAIERLLPVQESALGALDGGALLARLFLGGATHLQRLVLPLEDDLLLLRAGLGLEALGIALGVLDRLPAEQATRQESDTMPTTAAIAATTATTTESGISAPPVVGARLGGPRWPARPAHRSEASEWADSGRNAGV